MNFSPSTVHHAMSIPPANITPLSLRHSDTTQHFPTTQCWCRLHRCCWHWRQPYSIIFNDDTLNRVMKGTSDGVMDVPKLRTNQLCANTHLVDPLKPWTLLIIDQMGGDSCHVSCWRDWEEGGLHPDPFAHTLRQSNYSRRINSQWIINSQWNDQQQMKLSTADEPTSNEWSSPNTWLTANKSTAKKSTADQ